MQWRDDRRVIIPKFLTDIHTLIAEDKHRGVSNVVYEGTVVKRGQSHGTDI